MEVQGRDLGAPALGARKHLLGDEGSLGSSFLAAQALEAEGLALGLRALEPGRLLGEEVAEAPPELHHPQKMEGEAARGTVQEIPCSADELGDASDPLLVEVVDGAVVQELTRQEQHNVRVRGGATGVGR